MTVSIVLVAGVAVLFACGIYLLTERSLTRMLLGFLLLGNGANLLLLSMTGGAGIAPITGNGAESSEYTDPLPQAFALTAIVITFAVSAFLLALIHRAWSLSRRDEVEIDEEDIAVGTRDGVGVVEVESVDDRQADTEFVRRRSHLAVAVEVAADEDETIRASDSAAAPEPAGRDGEETR